MEKHRCIKPTHKIEEKKSSGGGSSAKPHFTEDQFVKILRDIRRKSVFKLGNKHHIIFIVELSDNKALYYVNEILKYFKGDLIYFISEHQFLMKSDESSIKELEEAVSKGKIPDKYKKYIINIKAMSADDKLSKNLIGMLETPSANMQKMKILGILMPKFDKQEYQYLIDDLKSYFMNEDIQAHEYYEDSLLTFTACINLSKIEEMAKKPYIYRISESPGIIMSNRISEGGDHVQIKDNREDLPKLCVIDSGFNKDLFDGLIIHYEKHSPSMSWDDEVNHGSKVASVAMLKRIDPTLPSFEPSCRIFAYKVTEDLTDSELHIAIKRSINLFKNRTRIFNLSSNYVTYNKAIADITNDLDKFIQKSNVILVNSCGNIPEEIISNNKYPDYLKIFPCKNPSIGKYIFAVGSYAKDDSNSSICKRRAISPYCAVGQNLDIEDDRIKPDILCAGGNLEKTSLRIKFNPDLGMDVIDNEGKLVKDIGTSLSAPLCSNFLARLGYIYPEIKNVETLKAILLSNCGIEKFNNNYIFKLPERIDEILYSTNEITYFSEGIIAAKRVYDKDHRKHLINTNILRFYVPKGIKIIKIFLVHSDNYEFPNPYGIDSSIKMEIYKLGRQEHLTKNDFSKQFLNEKSTIHFAEYICRKTFNTFWDIKLTPETTRNKVFDIRYGIAIKLLLGHFAQKDEAQKEIDEAMKPYT